MNKNNIIGITIAMVIMFITVFLCWHIKIVNYDRYMTVVEKYTTVTKRDTLQAINPELYRCEASVMPLFVHPGIYIAHRKRKKLARTRSIVIYMVKYKDNENQYWKQEVSKDEYDIIKIGNIYKIKCSKIIWE